MIYGVGTDIIRIGRIAAALKRHGTRFAEKILGNEELATYRQRAATSELRGVSFLATRFAAKEAFSKAIGLGMTMPMAWRAMQVVNDASGKPLVATSGALAMFMAQHELTAQVSITDEVDYAVAFVIVEKK